MDYQYTEFRLPPEDIANSQYVPEFGDVFGVNEVNQEYHELGTVLSDGGDMYGVSSVVFDKNEDLFWMGNQGGHVTSYYGPSMQKYTSFQVHASEEVRSLLSIDEGILALTKTTLRHQIRRGIPKFTHKSTNMVDMQCLIALESNRIVMGGHQNKLIEFDLTRLEETKQHSLGSLEARCAILRRHSYLLVAGDPSGRITLRDPISLRSQHVLDTHSASLSDFDVQGNLIVTCGFSNTQGALACDCFLLVYDVRALRPLPPLPVCCEPLLLRFMPAVASRLAAVTAHGQVQLVDTIHTAQPRLTMFQVNTQNCECLSFDISSTSQAFGFGDQSGHLHLFSPELNTEPAYNNFSRATEFADTPEEFPFVSYTDETFLPSSIPLPPLGQGARWLSEWPEQFTQAVYRMPRPIDPEVMRSIKMQGPIGYAPNPHTFRRNQMPYILEQPSSPSHGKSADNSYNSSSGEGDGSAFVAIPKRYRKVEVRYSKSGNNEFDFDHYNKTGFPGLEATLPNSYCNAMLQVLYYIFPVKRALYKHTCTKEFCLSCELGFLFRMLDTTPGAPCQASNFLRAFRTVPEASALGLILSDRNPEAKMKTNLGSLIQSWNRFILHQMHYEILETRKREMEADQNTQSLTDRLSTVNLSTPYENHTEDDPYRNEDFAYQPEDQTKDFFNSTPNDFIIDGNNSEGYQLKTPAWRKRREAEERDRISLLMVQDEGAGDSNTGDVNDSQSFDGFSDGYTNNDEHSKKQNHDETEISRLFGTKQLQVHKCLKCNREEHKESIVLLCNLQYPNKTPVDPVNFTDVLKSSLCPRKTTPAWCERCSKFSPTLQCCSVTQLPHLLAVNCGLTLPADKEFWQKQMDFTVSAALGHPVSYENNSGTSSTAPPSNRPCRYGTNCSRPGCRFKHPDDVSRNRVQASPSPTSIPQSNSNSPAPTGSTPAVLHHLYGQYPWLPHDIIARLSSSGQLTIDKMDVNGLNSKGDISNQYTKSKSWSPPSENGSMSSEYSENNHKSQEGREQETRRQYSLSAIVCYVDDAQKNIVSLIKMNGDEIPSRVPQNGQPQWYLFNDFCVSPISAAEVCWFNLEWKSPCVLFYRSVMAASHWSSTPSAHSFLGRRLSAGRVFGDENLSIAPTANFTPLTPHEFPKRGEIVGMDAEFVTLNQEEAELRSDGRLSTIRPSHLAVARITCVRGQGPLEGTPFIDDYISTQEQVVDYLTKFSGINPGDLDANFSSKHLTTLKSTYQKLRCLVDTGVLFVGHGLNNDFRVINLVVPPEQVIDTVHLFHLPHHRMVSLKFLAWHLLDTKIQSETHDSTEDARTALQLYRRYVELEAEGTVNQVLATLYETGKIMQWKVPED